MAVVSSVFLVITLALAVILGPQTRSWTWGPAMLALAVSVAAAIPVYWKRGRQSTDFGLLAFGLLAAGWFAWRAWHSPVVELGQADLMLIAAAAGTFASVRAIEGSPLGERILVWGIALLLLANVVVIGKQVIDPSFVPVFRTRAAAFPSGFYSHYNEAANYLIASSLLVGVAAFFSRQGALTRAIWGTIALGGLAAVYFTHSRGGILGAGIGVGIFFTLALVIGQREKAKWFAPALIGVPIVALVIAAFLWSGWQESQEVRRQGSTVLEMMDNNARLYLLGIALECIRLHPLAGGGSRSFSWENFRFADSKLQGDIISHLPEQVHNELLQSATDYGLIGAGLMAGMLGTLVLLAIIRVFFSTSSSDANAWRIGGLAAFGGMFVQSSFSFVFHLLPGVILLGLSLGMMARSSNGPSLPAKSIGSKALLTAGAIACLCCLVPFGLTGAKLSNILWGNYFSKWVPSAGTRIDALGDAIRLAPQSMFYQERAALHQAVAAETGGQQGANEAEAAIQDYLEAERLHPFHPGPAVNRAVLLGGQHRDADAGEAFARAIQLQGGMEPAFRGHFLLANHLMEKGVRVFDSNHPEPALDAMELAAREIETAVSGMQWVLPDMRNPRVAVHEGLGAAREANGDYKGAMDAYNFASKLENGMGAHYRAGLLNGKMAAAAWSARHSSEALGYFIEAKRRISLSNELPQGVSASQRIEYAAYLDKTIAYLKGAKVEPVSPPSN